MKSSVPNICVKFKMWVSSDLHARAKLHFHLLNEIMRWCKLIYILFLIHLDINTTDIRMTC